MKKNLIRVLTYLLALAAAIGGVTMAETATPAEAAPLLTAEAPNTVTTVTAAAEYLGNVLNASVEVGTDEDGCRQITVNAPFLKDTLFVQLGETGIVVRCGEEAVELSYSVLNEALGAYSYMSYGLDAKTARKLYAYANSGDAKQDEPVWQSILNTEMTRLLSLVMERGLFRMTDEGGFEVNATVADVFSLFAEYLTRAAADEALAASLSQLKLWECMGTDAQTGTQALLAQLTDKAEELKTNPPAGVSGSLQLSILPQGQTTLNFDLKMGARASEIHAEMVFDGEQLIASLRVNVGGRCFTLTATDNEDGLNAEFRMTETAENADATPSEAAEETVLWEGTLTYSEKKFTLEINTAAGGRLSFRLTEEGYDEYRMTFACAAGDFALDAEIHTDCDVFELEANLRLADTKARLTLNVNDDDVNGKLDVMGGENYLTINLHGRDDVFTLNGFGKVDDETCSVNAMFVDTYRGLEGTFNIEEIGEGGVSSIEGTVTYEEGKRYAYEYTILSNGEVSVRANYELTAEGVMSEMNQIMDGYVQRTEMTIEPTATGLNVNATVKGNTVDEDGVETESTIVEYTMALDGVNFVYDMRVKIPALDLDEPFMHATGTAIDEENRVAYRVDIDMNGETAYFEAGAVDEESEDENEVRGRLYLVTSADGEEVRYDLPISMTDTDTMTEIKLALETTENGVTQSIGSLSVKAETVVPETAPAHVTGTPITTEQLLEMLAQLAR